ncbi:MAG: MFS transporter, partial [Pseudomonadota bacterium]
SQSQQSDFATVVQATRPLWAFFVYDLYALGRELAGIEAHTLWAEALCIVATFVLIGHMLLTDRPSGNETDAKSGMCEFQKIMGAHAFSWVGMQTLFIFLFAFGEFRFDGMVEDDLGRFVSLSFLFLNAVAALLPAFVLGPMTTKRRRVFVHSSALAIMAAGFLGGYLFGASPVLIYISMVVLGVGWAAIVSLPFAIMSVRIDETRMGLFMGLFNLSVVLPQLFVSLGVALIVDRIEDKGVVFLIGAASLAVSAGLWLTVRRAGAPVESSTLAPAAGH